MQKIYRWFGAYYLLFAGMVTLLHSASVDYNGNPISKGNIVLTPQSIYNGGYLQSVNSPLIVGTLDQSFGGFLAPAPAGTTLLPNFLAGGAYVCRAVAIQSDGKIVLAGYRSVGPISRYSVARLLKNGQLDTTFNGTGYYVLPQFGAGFGDQCYGVALQSDGKIVLAGSSSIGGGSVRYLVVRLLSNGQLDTTFNGRGYYFLPQFAAGRNDQCYELVLQSDGKIVLAGYSYLGGGAYRNSVARVLTDGQIDLTFNGTGYYVLPQFAAVADNKCYGIALQSDGKIVLGGWIFGGGVWKYSVARVLTNGQLDTTFNGTGYYILPQFTVGNDDECYGVALQPDGKIVLIGRSSGGGGLFRYSVARVLTNGQLDTTFNETGYYVLPQFTAGSDDQCYGVALQSDGKIVLGGWMKVGGVYKYSAARLLTNGQLDTTFNGTGYYVLPQFSAGNNDQCYAVGLQSNQKIVLAGYSSTGVAFTYSAAQLTNEYTLADYQAEYPNQGGFY